MLAFKPRRSLTMLLALLLLILPACGGAEPEQSVAPTEAAPAPTEAAPEPAPKRTEAAEPTAEVEATQAVAVVKKSTVVSEKEVEVEAAAEEEAEASTSDLVDTLGAEGPFDTLIKALLRDNLRDEIENMAPVTFFAPTDEAFNKLPPESLNSLLDNPDLLKETLLYHVLEEPMKAEELRAQTEPRHDNGTPIAQLPTIQGDTVTIADFGEEREELKVNNANIIQSDIETQNGSIIHMIDIVLQPVGLAPPPAPDDLIQNIEVWEPYEEGEPLPIGDAELVPGAQEMHEGIRVLAEVLVENQAEINIARTIRLEAHEESYYLAPVGPDVMPTSQEAEALAQEQGLIVGVLVIDNQQPIEERAFVTRLRLLSKENGNEEWSNELLSSNGEVVAKGKVSLAVDDMEMGEIPSAAMLYGSHLCQYWFPWWDGHPCMYCAPWLDEDAQDARACH